MIDTNLRDLPAHEAFNRYLADVDRTMNIGQSDLALKLNIVQGIMGELGEIMDFDKKIDHNGRPDDIEKREEEVGDFMFYFCAYLALHKIDLIAALESNMRKRALRFPDGYSHEAAIARADKNIENQTKLPYYIKEEKATRICTGCGKPLTGTGAYCAPGSKGSFHKGCAIAFKFKDQANKGIKSIGPTEYELEPTPIAGD